MDETINSRFFDNPEYLEVDEVLRPIARAIEEDRNDLLLNKKRKMTDRELKKELLKLCNTAGTYYLKDSLYFLNKELFKKDKIGGYKRRTFSDLFHYFKQFGVTEKQLMKALKENLFVALFCFDIHDIVFFRKKNKTAFNKAINSRLFTQTVIDNHKRRKRKNKFTYDYLKDLYDSV